MAGQGPADPGGGTPDRARRLTAASSWPTTPPGRRASPCSPSRACDRPQPAVIRPSTTPSGPSSALACGPSADCADGATNLNTPTTRPRKPAPAKPLKHCRPPARSSTPPPGSSPASDSSDHQHNGTNSAGRARHAAATGPQLQPADGRSTHISCSRSLRSRPQEIVHADRSTATCFSTRAPRSARSRSRRTASPTSSTRSLPKTRCLARGHAPGLGTSR